MSDAPSLDSVIVAKAAIHTSLILHKFTDEAQ